MPIDPEKVKNIQVSPDGLKYAVVDALNGSLKILSVNGQLLELLPPGEFPYGIDHWLNNEQLALVILEPWFGTYYKYPFDQLILNTSTGEQKHMISEQYPDIDVANARMFWEGGSTTKYDPLLTRVVYPAGIEEDYLEKSGMGYVLWDLENRVKLVEFVTGYFSVTPKWIPDGSMFVINDSHGDGEFYTVTRDGAVTQLSHLNSGLASKSSGVRYFSDLYSWSPDGRHLAFWLESRQNSLIKGTFAILDIETGKVTDTCISAGFEGNYVPRLDDIYLSPIWSPDGKYVVTQANKREDRSYQSALINLEERFVVMIGENIFPVGWLADGDN
jgi:WD40 repeat protein